MDLQIPSLPIIFTFCTFIFMIIMIVNISKSRNVTPKLPPGPWKLPIIGNLHQLVCSLPHHQLRKLANKYGPIMHLQLGQISTVIISSPEVAKEVMKTQDINFASRPQPLAAKIMTYDLTDIGFAPYGSYWKLLRKICISELLNAKRVESFRSLREHEAHKLIAWITSKAGNPINLTKRLFTYTYGFTAKAAFGNDCEDRLKFISIIDETSKVMSGFNISDLFPSFKILQVITGINGKLERIHQEGDQILEGIISEHRKKEKEKETMESSGNGEAEDLVDVLLREQARDDLEILLTDDNLKAVINDIFGAGSETAATVVDWAMAEMMMNPTVMEKAQSEVRHVFDEIGGVDESLVPKLQYLKLVVKETLRLHPPAPLLLPRECQETCEINGYLIPAKTQVIVNAWAIGRDPRFWKDPDKFYPERFLENFVDYKGSHFEYIPFGAGRRICPGIVYGLANVNILLAMLLYYVDWKFPDGITMEKFDMTEEFGVAVRRKQDLILVPFINHRSSPLDKLES